MKAGRDFTVGGVALAAVFILAVGLTGCGEPYPERMSEDERYVLCVENGGSWATGAWGEESCTIPEDGGRDGGQ